MAPVIEVRGLGKRFTRDHPDRPYTLIEAVARGLRGLRPAGRFWALREVSFEVGRGRMLGIIGRNGAGKSTLLRLIGGVGRPDEGTIEARGRIGALLELGTGLSPELTGHENLLLNGVIGGLTRAETLERYDRIVAFAELEEAIESPLRTYSSGMQMRLAFSVAAHIEPDILLVDEVLAVGDRAFQQKCLERIHTLRHAGCTIVLVSHDLGVVREICDEAIWLEGGRIAAHGPPDEVVTRYIEESERYSATS